MCAHLLRRTTPSIVTTILLVALTLQSSCSAHAGTTAGLDCVSSEREALLSFRESFLDPSGRLSSWRGEGDCCQWRGVRCSSKTGHVIELDLRNNNPDNYYGMIVLRGEMSSSIVGLRRLRYLDLSFNYFNGTRIPPFLGNLSSLRYLSLAKAGFAGPIPFQLSNLSRLQHLDLSYDPFDFGSVNFLQVPDLSWLLRLFSLESLYMTGQDLSSVSDWVHKVNVLPNLKILSLSGCSLNSTVASLSHSNLTNLEILDLSDNEFDYYLLKDNWFWGVTTIKKLLLSQCGWSGHIPNVLGNMSSLEVLSLDMNFLTGVIPRNLGKLCNMQLLDLSFNDIKGDMTEILLNCSWSKLHMLNLQGSNLSGQLPVWIGNLTSLSHFDVSQNKLVGSIPSGIKNMRSLSYLDLSQNMLAGDVPDGIGSLSNLTFLNLGSNNLSGILSEQHFASLVNLEHIDLSRNSLKINIMENWIPPFGLKKGYFGSCDMGPQFPAWLRWQKDLKYLDISNASINDVLPQWFWAVFSDASNLDLSRNKLMGVLPENLDLPLIGDLNLSSNSLSGQLPENITAPYLKSLFLHDNYFSGTIPIYVCYGFYEVNISNNKLTGNLSQCSAMGSSLQMLDLKNNNLDGEFPNFLQNSLMLSFLDLSHNKFSGNVPVWIAEEMPNLEVLILRSNLFHGHIPKQLTKLIRLHYLDIAHNNLSGSIPSSLGWLTAMTYSNSSDARDYTSDSISTFIKDRELNYTHELTKRIVLIDLSSNALTGHIPDELSFLKGLRSLNLSGNQLSGAIPEDIGVLRGLESLDLSHNHFNGEIPSSLSKLTFLSCLNLSYNDLSGRIPSGQQLQTLNDQYMYIGNPGLCGPPLQNNCSINDKDQNVNKEHEGETHDISSFYLSLSIGFVVGLWTVFCAMLLKETWRVAYFRLCDMLYDKVYVQLAINKVAFMRTAQEVVARAA